MLRFLLWLTYKVACKGGETLPLVTVTVALIIAGRRKFSEVPATIRDAVQADLLALGLGTDGKPLE